MTNFIKFCIVTGCVTLLCLAYVLLSHEKRESKTDLEKAKHELKQVEFDRDFSDSWNRQKSEMASSKEDKEYWKQKNEADQKLYAEKQAEAKKNIAEAKEQLEKKTKPQDQFSQDFQKVISDMPEVTDEEFNKAIKDFDKGK